MQVVLRHIVLIQQIVGTYRYPFNIGIPLTDLETEVVGRLLVVDVRPSLPTYVRHGARKELE